VQLRVLGCAAGQGEAGLDHVRDRPRTDPEDRIAPHQTMMRAQFQTQNDVAAAEAVATRRRIRAEMRRPANA
jgi:hypothetical protein